MFRLIRLVSEEDLFEYNQMAGGVLALFVHLQLHKLGPCERRDNLRF